MDSLGQELGQGTVGMTFLCPMTYVWASAREHKAWGWESSEGAFTHVSRSWCPLSAGGLSFSPHEPLHVVSPHRLVWALSQHGG